MWARSLRPRPAKGCPRLSGLLPSTPRFPLPAPRARRDPPLHLRVVAPNPLSRTLFPRFLCGVAGGGHADPTSKMLFFFLPCVGTAGTPLGFFSPPAILTNVLVGAVKQADIWELAFPMIYVGSFLPRMTKQEHAFEHQHSP